MWNIGRLSRNGRDACEWQIKSIDAVCVLQEVRSAGSERMSSWMFGIEEGKFYLWWSGNRVSGVGVMVNMELCEI